MRSSQSLTLVGHDCPLECYPAFVTPVVEDLDGRRSAVIFGASWRLELLTNETVFVRHDRTPRVFDPDTHRLFAFSEQDVEVFSVDSQRDYYASLLRSNRVTDPFLRLSLARQVGVVDQMRAELRGCVLHLSEVSPHLLPGWLQQQEEESADDDPIRGALQHLYASLGDILSPVAARIGGRTAAASNALSRRLTGYLLEGISDDRGAAVQERGSIVRPRIVAIVSGRDQALLESIAALGTFEVVCEPATERLPRRIAHWQPDLLHWGADFCANYKNLRAVADEISSLDPEIPWVCNVPVPYFFGRFCFVHVIQNDIDDALHYFDVFYEKYGRTRDVEAAVTASRCRLYLEGFDYSKLTLNHRHTHGPDSGNFLLERRRRGPRPPMSPFFVVPRSHR